MVGGTVHAAKSNFLLLSEAQNAAFHAEFHSFEELDAKFQLLDELIEDRPFKVLDLGGGNGLFADQLLARFPKSSVAVLDISSLLLENNTLSYRKELIQGSIEFMGDILVGRKFDCITVNWVLHHLVGRNYDACRKNCLDTLKQCRNLLNPNGILLVAENMFDGYLRSNLPSHLIYAITSIRAPWFVRLTKRFFNTAGVGVCFRSQQAWQDIFAESGFDSIAFQRGYVWELRSLRAMAFHLLFLRSVCHGHFFLRHKGA